jgi:N-carbamoyl-L-amino-acid hydrolase
VFLETASIGGTPKGGICRLTLTDLDRQVRDWFRARAEALGCTVTVDDMGVMFARRPGQRADVPPIAMGSHLDTQPTGGKFDGNLGVLGALEAMRTLVAAGYETNAPFVVVNWTNEEGARFAPAMLGSGVFAGVYSRAEADAIADIEGVRFGEALDRIGWRGAAKAGAMPLSAYLELHIEQGGILDAEHLNIGIVEGIVGISQWEVTIDGFANHAGTTPMNQRHDALLAAARYVEAVNRVVTSVPGRQVGTVGRIQALPGAYNVIPGKVVTTLELRDLDAAKVQTLFEKVKVEVAAIEKSTGTTFTFQNTNTTLPAPTDQALRALIEAGAKRLGFTTKVMPSGAGHDAQEIAPIAPVGMIFVPSRAGISHSPKEFSSATDITNGANVLLLTLLALDAR